MVSALLVMLLLQRGAGPGGVAVAGQLQMTNGSPAVAVRVAAIPAPPPNIRPTDGQNYYASQAPVRTALSDAAGAYRLDNLPPGRYYLVAGAVGHATYFPGTTDIEAAEVVTIAADVSVGRFDFKLLRFPGTRVRGRVTPPPMAGQERAVLSGVLLGELLESPVGADGAFEFGRVPKGTYLLSLYPPPSGMLSRPFQVGGEEEFVTLELTRPPARTVSGRITVDRGPLPRALLGFTTELGYVPATINADGTFTVRLHAARHRAEMGGLPVGYEMRSVRVGGQEVLTDGLTVAAGDVTGIAIAVASPDVLPRLRGRVVSAGPLPPGTRVEATGPIVGSVEAAVQADGSFDFPALPPGLYRVRVPQLAAIPVAEIVVDTAGTTVELGRR